ncbi:MAG: cytochrome c3 family protein [Anaerolineaceae bacterium]|nr:cytochrome c3 family protein [Anaerolineaceae bacterium]
MGKEIQKKVKKKMNWSKILLILVVSLCAIVSGGLYVNDYAYKNPGFCNSCHVMNEHVDSYLNVNNMDHYHFKAGVNCKDCHSDYKVTDELTSVVKFISGNYSVPLEKKKVKDDMCLQCHISMEYQADATDFLFRNPHRSHWDSLRCTSCHISHGEQVDYCSTCHDNGGQRMTGSETAPRDIVFPDHEIAQE